MGDLGVSLELFVSIKSGLDREFECCPCNGVRRFWLFFGFFPLCKSRNCCSATLVAICDSNRLCQFGLAFLSLCDRCSV